MWGLGIRMMLYLGSGLVAGQGLGVFDPEAGTLLIDLKNLELVLGGFVTFIATFIASRFAVTK